MRPPSSTLSSIQNIVFTHKYYNINQLQQYKKYIQDHLTYYNYLTNITLDCDKQIDKLIDKLSSPPKTIYDLINQIYDTHTNQAYILQSILQRQENDCIYLTNYEKNTSTLSRNSNIEGTFTILGTLRNNKREHYEVKLYKNNLNDKGSFWCNCPDHKFNSKKKNIVCKHISFIVCKVAKIFDTNYFETKILTPEQFNIIVNKAENLYELLQDSSIYKPPKNITLELFNNHTKTINNDDICPICYDTFTNTSLTCPTCHNYIHKECMNLWLEKKHTCVYCRSDVWKLYKEL